MGLLDFLFKSKKKLNTEAAQVRQSPISQTIVSFSDDFMKIKSIGFSGLFNKSKSGEWVIGWRDSVEQNRWGNRERVHGCYVLYNAIQNRIILQGKIERPNSGRVANNGCFSIEDSHFGGGLSGTFYVFSPAGKELIKKRLNAIIFNSGISDEGRFAICQTACNPKSVDGNLLIAFSIEQGNELFSLHPTTEWANSYKFIENTAHFVVIIKNIGKFRYDSQGNFIDAEKYDAARLNCNEFVAVLLAAEQILKEPTPNHEHAQAALAAARRARSLGADNDQGWKAVALKIQGMAHESLGNSKEALSAYDDALKINPKIGVKRKADTLRKKLKSARP